MSMERIAFITGATSGIGRATAIAFARAGFNLLISGRRQKLLDELAAELTEMGVAVLPLCFDVQKRQEVMAAIEGLDDYWKNIDILVNNAGLAVGLAPIQDGVIDDWERMIDTNIKGLLYVTRAVSPLMVKRQKGHIVNLASIAGKEIYPNGNVYCATKHAVDALSRAMRDDLLKYNILVTNIAPGKVETEFSLVRFNGDKGAADKGYEGMKPLSGEDVADVILYAVTRPAHVCLNDIVIMPSAQSNARDVIRKI
ncbi:short-chain dehydrogenase [Bacteroidia bacterium]|nr:short-chain dehydrogenase [Bacteroidia bacterium]